MPKKDITLTEKIARLDKQKEQLLAKRKDELFSIFINTASVAIDNKLLTGFLLFLNNSTNNDHAILKEFKELATRNKIPSNTKSANT
jgi:hypothetical protein